MMIAVGTSAALPAGSTERPVVNIAHRGGISDGYPENTLAAFRRAMAVGADVGDSTSRVKNPGAGNEGMNRYS